MNLKTLTIAVSLLSAGLALAESPPVKPQVSIAIARQPMADALTELGRQIGMQVVIDSTLARGRTAPAVSGKLTVDQAMRSILKDTGLQYEFVDERTIAVVSTAARTTAGASGSEGVRFARTDEDQLQKVETGTAEPLPAADSVELRRPDGTAEILVRGTRDTGVVNQGVIPRTENEAVRYEVIDRKAIERSGATSLSDLLNHSVSQSSNYGTGTQQSLGQQSQSSFGTLGVGTAQDEINLRGLGSAQTLVLINGRRLYGASDSSGPDISRIPLSMVERIEILPSSGSAIYGANAMAGVVNIILRKDYTGSDYGAYFGAANGGAQEYRLTGTQGFNFNDRRINVAVNVEYKKVDRLDLGEREYYKRALDRLSPSSPNNRYVNNIVKTLIGPVATVFRNPAGPPPPPGVEPPPAPALPGLNSNFAAVPSGSNGVGLTPASFTATDGIAGTDTALVDQSPLVGPGESAGLFATLEHALTDRISAFGELSYRWNDNSAGTIVDTPPNLSLAANSPYNPFGVPVNVAVDPIDLPRTHQTSVQRSYRAVGGLRGTMNLFGGREYKWSGDLSWDRNETEATNISYRQFLRSIVTQGIYNPLRDLTGAPLLPADELSKYRLTSRADNHPVITATNWRANGDLFNAWGGMAGISVGAEYRHQVQYSARVNEFSADTYADFFTQDIFANLPPDESTRDTYAGYVEVTVPLVGERNRMPLVEKLDLSAATRYEKYDDFDAAKPGMVALKWSLLRDVALRAQYSEGFQPPTQGDLSSQSFQEVFEIFGPPPVDPLRDGLLFPGEDPVNGPEAAILLSGGNPDLRPETANNWDVGVILTPRWVPGLMVNAAYFEYDKKDVIADIGIQGFIDAGFVTRGDNLPDDTPGVPGPITLIDARTANIARQFINGFDVSASYAFETSAAGDFTISAQTTRTTKFRQQTLLTDPKINTVGELDDNSETPVRWAGHAALDWQWRGWGASWTSRYTNSYEINSNDMTDLRGYPFRRNLDGPYIPSHMEHDVQFRYQVGEDSSTWGNLLSGTELTLGANNVFNTEPELLTNAGNLWYSFFSDPRQRFVYFQLKKSF